MIYYYGTSYANGRMIMQDGFAEVDRILLMPETGNGLNRAVNNARKYAAINGSTSESLCIIKININSPAGAKLDDREYLQVDAKTLKTLLDSGKADMDIRFVKNAYNPYLRAAYLAMPECKADHIDMCETEQTLWTTVNLLRDVLPPNIKDKILTPINSFDELPQMYKERPYYE